VPGGWRVMLDGSVVVESFVRPLLIVQQRLITPTEPSFENCCTDGIRGLVFRSAFTQRSTGRAGLYFAAA
jgi:hypothetical protein